MISAAGIFFVTPEGLALFLHRGNGSDHPLEWCFPGGQQEEGESIEECALRETLEEAGFKANPKDLVLHTRSLAPAEMASLVPVVEEGVVVPEAPSEEVDFTTYICRVPEPFEVTICEESTGYAWASIASPPQPIHPGCAVAISRLSMDERQVAEAMSRQELTSPQVFDNCCLFDIRITGTGVAYRHSLDEFVWRDAGLYLNDHFLNRCNGLFVIWEHPPTATLNSKEFAKRIVGSVMLAYIKGDEVWAIARIMDEEAIELMSSKDEKGNPLSTSPAVVFKDPKVNTRMILEDGSTMLIEGKPSLLDHIAICEQGVWDKGKPPEGISVADSLLAPASELDPEALQGLADSISLLDVKLATRVAERKLNSMEKSVA